VAGVTGGLKEGMMSEQHTALALIETLNPVAIFQSEGGVEDIIGRLERDVRAIPTDPTTDKGRKHIKSLAHAVARSKTALDEAGKAVQADARKTVDKVNADRRLIVKRLDDLRDEVRAPVTEYEARETARTDAHKTAIRDIEELARFEVEPTESAVAHRLAVMADYDGRNWEEFSERGQQAFADAISTLNAHAEAATARRIAQEQAEEKAAYEAEQARIRAEEERKKREAEIAKEAEARALAEAALAIEREKKEKRAALDAMERERIETHQRAIRWIGGMAADAAASTNTLNQIEYISELFESMEEITRNYEEFQAQADKAIKDGRTRIKDRYEEVLAREAERSAQMQAANEAQAALELTYAIEAERKRVSDEKARIAAEEQRRTNDRAHKAKINREILTALESIGIETGIAKTVIAAVIGGGIPHMTIRY